MFNNVWEHISDDLFRILVGIFPEVPDFCDFRLLISSSKGFSSFSVKIDSWEARISFPFLHGWFSWKQWISSSFEPSVGRFNAHDGTNSLSFLVTTNPTNQESILQSCILFVCFNKRPLWILFVWIKLPLMTEGGALIQQGRLFGRGRLFSLRVHVLFFISNLTFDLLLFYLLFIICLFSPKNKKSYNCFCSQFTYNI